MYPLSDPATVSEIGYNTIFYPARFTAQVKSKNLITLTSGGADAELWEDSWANSELYRVYGKKDTHG